MDCRTILKRAWEKCDRPVDGTSTQCLRDMGVDVVSPDGPCNDASHTRCLVSSESSSFCVRLPSNALARTSTQTVHLDHYGGPSRLAAPSK